jgi:hypothetical protein
MGVCFHRGPTVGELGGTLLSWDLLIQRNLHEVFKRYAKCPVGSPGGGSFARIFERRKSIPGFLSWTQRTLRCNVWGSIWNFSKGTGLS